MGASVDLQLPYPPTVNTYWRHVGPKVLVSAAGRRYRQDVAAAVFVQYRPRKPLAGRLAVSVALHPPDRRRRDLDNAMKALLDSLKHAGVYEDDSQIDRLSIERESVTAGGVAVVQIVEGD